MSTDTKPTHALQERDLLKLLRELGGEATMPDEVKRGAEFVVPASMTLDESWRWLKRKSEEEDNEAQFSHTFKYRPFDGAHAAYVVMRDWLGGVRNCPTGAWGNDPPKWIDIEVGYGETVQVPWGLLEPGSLSHTLVAFGAEKDAELGALFQMQVRAPRKLKTEIDGLFKLVEKQLAEGSIYRGKAIDGRTDKPEFQDVNGVDKDKIVYAEQTEIQLGANLFAPITFQESGKKAILLEGPYGTGKTSAGMIAAQLCAEAGRTFIMVRPGRDDLHAAMQTARLYQPSLVFFEDADTIGAAAQADIISRTLDVLDGLQTKGTDVYLVMTTNHVQVLHPGIIRRFNDVIHVGSLDTYAIQRLAVGLINGHLADEIEWERVGTSMEGYLPSFVAESFSRAVRYNKYRNGGETTKLTTDDLVEAAEGLRRQFQLMQDAPDSVDRPEIDQAVEGIVEAVTDRIVEQRVESLRDDMYSDFPTIDTTRSIVENQVREVMNGTRVIDNDGDEMYRLDTN